MKQKAIFAGVVVMALLVSFVFARLDSQTMLARTHQHQQAAQGQTLEEDATHLPIVALSTKGQTIPGEVILDDKKNVIGYTMSDTNKKMAKMELSIIDQENKENHLEDTPDFTTASLVRYRGNSSRYFAKKGYLLRFVDEDGNDNDHNVMGMGKESEWILHGPFMDRTLMRNYLCMNVIGQIMPFTPEVRYCRLYVDGVDQGLYLMMESIRQGETRVNIRENSQDDHYISYIVRLDKDPLNETALDTFSFYTYLTQDHNTRYGVIYPGRSKLSEAWKTYIEDDLSKIEKALYSYDFNDEQSGYPAYLDVDSFVDYYIFMEFFGVRDFGNRSTYLYKDGKGKLSMGPAWDFNNAMDNFMREQPTSGMQLVDRYWYHMLFKDEAFVHQVIKRYETLRTNVLSQNYLYDYIDEVAQYLGKEIDHNFAIWPQSLDVNQLTNFEKLQPDERNPESWEASIIQMKHYIHDRGTWLDEHIDTLYQYCHDSKNKDELLK